MTDDDLDALLVDFYEQSEPGESWLEEVAPAPPARRSWVHSAVVAAAAVGVFALALPTLWTADRPDEDAGADVAEAVELSPEGEAPAEPDPAHRHKASDARAAKVVVRRERSGRGGKAVTLVEQLGWEDAQRCEEQLARLYGEDC